MPMRFIRTRRGDATRTRGRAFKRRRRRGTSRVTLGSSNIMNAILAGKLYRFKRMCARPGFVTAGGGITVTNTANRGTQWSIAAATEGYFAFAGSLNDLQGVADFTVLFDQYRLNAVQITITYRYSEGDVGGGVNMQQPYIVTVNDYDDATVPTSELQLSEYSTAKKRYFNATTRSLSYFLRPRFNLVSNDGTNTGGAQLPQYAKPWLDIAAPAIQHWGLKGCIVNTAQTAATTVAYFDVSAKYYLSFKVVR